MARPRVFGLWTLSKRFSTSFPRWRASWHGRPCFTTTAFESYERPIGSSSVTLRVLPTTSMRSAPGVATEFFSGARIAPSGSPAYWACLARGITVVPLDFRSSPDFVSRVQRAVQAKLLLCGAAVESEALAPALPFIGFQELSRLSSAEDLGTLHADSNDVVQVLFTSGTTGEPKGVVHRHRHLVSTLVPIRSEIAKYRAYARPFQPIRFLDLLPLSHVFGQFNRALHPTRARRFGRLHAGSPPRGDRDDDSAGAHLGAHLRTSLPVEPSIRASPPARLA